MSEVPSSSQFCPMPTLSALVHSTGLPIYLQRFMLPDIPSAHTAIVTSNDVPSNCFMYVMDPTSCAWKLRTTLKAEDRILTAPSWLPKNRLFDPEQTQLISLFSRKDLVSSSGGLTWETSKKSNVFHYIVSVRNMRRIAGAYGSQCHWETIFGTAFKALFVV